MFGEPAVMDMDVLVRDRIRGSHLRGGYKLTSQTPRAFYSSVIHHSSRFQVKAH